jgi:type IV secretion system protein VirB10
MQDKDSNKEEIVKGPEESSDANPMSDMNSIPSNIDINSKDSLYHNELEEKDEKAEIDFSKTQVGRNTKQSMVMAGVLGLVICIIIYFSFFRHSQPSTNNNEGLISTPVGSSEELSLPEIPNTPPPPADFNLPSNTPTPRPVPQPPIAPPVAKPKPAIEQPPPVATPLKTSDQQRSQAKITSSIMLTSKSEDKDSKKAAPMYVENFVPEHTSSTQQQITHVGNMSLLIAQGKIIEAVLETPVNTNYPGPIRGIVSSDVYSEKGNNILIPKGSRLIGQFAGGYTPGQTRIIFIWSRIIMPDGYDIDVQSPAVSPLGTTGVEGIVDTQLAPAITNAVLFSALNIAFADLASKATGSNNSSTTTSTTNTDGSITSSSTSSPTQQAIQQQTTALGNTVQNLTQQSFTTKPFITLDQGTLVSVFVNRDLLFPSNLSNGAVTVR